MGCNSRNKTKVKSRTNAIKRYIAGRKHDVSEEEIQAFQSGFNMAWKTRDRLQFQNMESE